MISFTGSTVVGKRIMERGAATLKRVFLELGGKSAMLVCDDADFASVLPTASMACMHAGQGCGNLTRLLLPRSSYAEGVEIVSEVIGQVSYGDPTDPANLQGPQISAKQRDRVMSYIQQGVDEGATLALGGRRPPQFEKGFFVEPTLFVDVDRAMTIAQEEIFGPVLVVIPYDDDDDAIRIANDSNYGLSGGVFSASTPRAMAIARKIRTGTISVNGGVFYGADAPYGGYKMSGTGRQSGIEGFNAYLETKVIGLPA
jgi:aldehyde dehydrogenase (NAD+)